MLLFTLPVMTVLGIYIAAAVLPAVFLMRYIYAQDTVEKEPPGLLASLAAGGVLAALAAAVLELAGEALLPHFISPSSPLYVAALAFLVVAVAEEGAKLFFLYRRSWYSPEFNYRFDGIVYSVFTSLGFAAFENIKYVFAYGLSVALPRAVLAVPGHMGFAVFMGLFYGRARLRANLGDEGGCRANLAAGYLSAVILHGTYDTCAMLGSGRAAAAFVAFVAVMYFVVIRLVRREARTDEPVY